MKTLKLIDQYFKLLEQDQQQPVQEPQPVDATDIETQPEEPEAPELTTTGERDLIALLSQAFVHVPTEQELNMVAEVERKMGKDDPRAIVATIRTILPSTRSSDEDMIDRIDRE